MIYLVTKEGLSPGGLEFENSIVSVYRMRVFGANQEGRGPLLDSSLTG